MGLRKTKRIILNKIKQGLKKYIEGLGLDFSLLLENDYEDYKTKLEESIYVEFFEDIKDIKQKKQYKLLIKEIIDEIIDSFLNSCKRYLPKEQHLEEAIVESLSILIDNYNYEINSKDIYRKLSNFNSELSNKDLAKRSLANIKCLFIADYIYRSRNDTSYKINFDKWFNEYRRYHIHNKDILKAISPLMVSYMKSNINITTDDFFEVIEKLISEFVSPIENNSYTYNVERKIYDNIESEVTIILNRNKNIRNKTIIPQKIIINEDNSKSIEYYDSSTNKVENIALDSIIDINDTKLTAINYLESKYKIKIQRYKEEIEKSALFPFDIDTKLLQSKYVEEEHQIILECDTTSLDYFLIKPLKKQNIYSTQSELLEFKELYNYEIKDNKFYVTATDSITNASYSVLKCLGEIKVITPISLNDFIVEKIQKHNSLYS